MMETFGIGQPKISTISGKPQLIYTIPLPAGYEISKAIESMTGSIKRANYGFDAAIYPAAVEPSASIVHLHVDVPETDHADPMRLHSISFGLALRVREELPIA